MKPQILRGLRFLFSLVVACGPMGVPGAAWPVSWAGLLDAPVGGGPPARRPRCELRSARRLEARPGPATAHRHRGRSLRRPSHLWGRAAPWAAARPLAVRAASFARRVALKPGQAPPPPINFARNSPAACSNIEFASLELQRFQALLKLRPIELRARFGWRWCRRCPWVLQPGPAAACGRP